MGFFIGLLTVVMVLNCGVLVLLVLMQLPKKDAGAGLAFGGGATDALFGAGSGNVLTKATKYSASIFFVLAVVIGMLQGRYHQQSVTELIKATASAPATTPLPGSAETPPPAPVSTPTAAPEATSVTPGATNFQLEIPAPAVPAAEATSNVPSTN